MIWLSPGQRNMCSRNTAMLSRSLSSVAKRNAPRESWRVWMGVWKAQARTVYHEPQDWILEPAEVAVHKIWERHIWCISNVLDVHICSPFPTWSNTRTTPRHHCHGLKYGDPGGESWRRDLKRRGLVVLRDAKGRKEHLTCQLTANNQLRS